MERLIPLLFILQATSDDRQRVDFIMSAWVIGFAVILTLLVVAIFYFSRKK